MLYPTKEPLKFPPLPKSDGVMSTTLADLVWTDGPGDSDECSYRGLTVQVYPAGAWFVLGSNGRELARGHADDVDTAKVVALNAARLLLPAPRRAPMPAPAFAVRRGLVPSRAPAARFPQTPAYPPPLRGADKRMDQAARARASATFFRSKLARLQKAPRVPVASPELRARLEGDVIRARQEYEFSERELAAAQAKPDHWPSKPALVAKREAYLELASVKVALAGLALPPDGTERPN